MTQRRWIVLAIGQCVLIVVLIGLQFRHPPGGAVPGGDARPDRPDHPAAAVVPFTVQLTPEVVAASGIRSAALQALNVAAVDPDWAEVQSATPLAEARLRLQQADAEVDQWPVQVAAARLELERQRALFQQSGTTSQRVVDQAQASLRQLEQRAEAAQATRADVQAAVQAEFGAMVLDALRTPGGGALAEVLNGAQVLLLVASAADTGASQGEVLQTDGTPLHTVARRFAPATHALASTAAPSWYWLAKAAGLRAGQRVRLMPAASVHRGGTGVLLPEAAVVWQSGSAWIWQPSAAGTFVRRSVIPGAAVKGGWLVSAGLSPGQTVVVEGAQLLLSEESRAQIRNENGD